MMFILSLLAVAGLTFSQPARRLNGTSSEKQLHCQPTDPCWPTEGEIEAFKLSLDPSMWRATRWDGCSPFVPDECHSTERRHAYPLNAAIPAYSPFEQPLYGLGSYAEIDGGLLPLYVREQTGEPMNCFPPPPEPEERNECFAALRNNPQHGWQPAFTVFAMTTAHVQSAVRFAVRHNLCVMVAGTGHDFVNRHSCDNGVFIRTILLKSQEWNLSDSRWRDGTVRLGSGNTFHEIQKVAAERGRYVSQGWAISVGIVGWSIGGGHGPFAPQKGMGIDNIVEVEIVSADGSLIVANENRNSDLWWAVRGGGGSTWGVITSITVRAHATPVGGFVKGAIAWSGGMCAIGRARLHNLIDRMAEWQLKLNSKFAGLTFHTLEQAEPIYCGGTWHIGSQYVYLGPMAGEAEETFDELQRMDPFFEIIGGEYENVWEMIFDQAIEHIFPTPWESSQPGKRVIIKHRQSSNLSSLWKNGVSDVSGQKNAPPGEVKKQLLAGDQVRHASSMLKNGVGGVPSVSVNRSIVASGALGDVIKASADLCASGDSAGCERHEVYQCVTGQTDSPQDPRVSVSPAFREAFAHVVVGGHTPEEMENIYYPLGASSYISESSYVMDNWATRYWGEENYRTLVGIKNKYDPNGVFWCHHCIGDDN